jgi:AraC-like DNA-binding protein
METFRVTDPDGWVDAVGRTIYPLALADVGSTFRATIHANSLDRGVRVHEVLTDPNILVRTRRLVRSSPSDDMLLLVQMAGAATLRQRDRVVHLPSCTATLCDPLVEYAVRCDKLSHQLVLMLPRASVRELSAPVSELRLRRMDAHTATLRALIGVARESLHAEAALDRPESDVLAGAILDLTRAALVRLSTGSVLPTSHDGVARTALAYIRAHCDDPVLDPERVARAAGVSLRTLSTALGDEGPPGRAIRAERLHRARERLLDPRHGRSGVAEIAVLSGFRDATTFTRAFRREFGSAPSELRRA